jgi:hypothetical protein
MLRFLTCGLIDCSKPCCIRNIGSNDEVDGFAEVVYSSGESDTEFATSFNDLSTLEKKTRIFFLWNKLFNRARGALLLIRKNEF